MKIIDFERRGNVVRFYLGEDDCEDYRGDDWDDVPYEHNAGEVYPEYVVGYRDIVFPFEFIVVEPKDDFSLNSSYCKDDMKARRVPCLAVLKASKEDWFFLKYEFDKIVANDKSVKFYFGDKLEPSKELTIWSGK